MWIGETTLNSTGGRLDKPGSAEASLWMTEERKEAGPSVGKIRDPVWTEVSPRETGAVNPEPLAE